MRVQSTTQVHLELRLVQFRHNEAVPTSIGERVVHLPLKHAIPIPRALAVTYDVELDCGHP